MASYAWYERGSYRPFQTSKQLEKERQRQLAADARKEQRRKEALVREHDKAECEASMKTRHLRLEQLFDGIGSRAKRHLDLTEEDETVFDGFINSAIMSCTCEALSPEELMIQAEEALEYEEAAFALETAADEATKDTEELVKELAEDSLSEYFEQLFGLTPKSVELDEHYLGISSKEPKVRYRSRPNWATT